MIALSIPRAEAESIVQRLEVAIGSVIDLSEPHTPDREQLVVAILVTLRGVSQYVTSELAHQGVAS